MASVVFTPLSVRVQIEHTSSPFIFRVIFKATSLVIPCVLSLNYILDSVHLQSFCQG